MQVIASTSKKTLTWTVGVPEKTSKMGDTGVDLPDDAAAQRHAQVLARDLRSAGGPSAARLKSMFVRARRSDGREVARVPVSKDKPDREREH